MAYLHAHERLFSFVWAVVTCKPFDHKIYFGLRKDMPATLAEVCLGICWSPHKTVTFDRMLSVTWFKCRHGLVLISIAYGANCPTSCWLPSWSLTTNSKKAGFLRLNLDLNNFALSSKVSDIFVGRSVYYQLANSLSVLHLGRWRNLGFFRWSWLQNQAMLVSKRGSCVVQERWQLTYRLRRRRKS
jgi:hypothetical protein